MMSILYNKRMTYWQTLKAQLNESRGDKRAKKKTWVSNFLSFNYSSWEEGEKRGKKEEGRRKRKRVTKRTILRMGPSNWLNQKKKKTLVSSRVS